MPYNLKFNDLYGLKSSIRVDSNRKKLTIYSQKLNAIWIRISLKKGSGLCY
jgi:phage-related protein